MRRRKVTDRDVLTKSLTRRLRHAMVRILHEYDARHSDSDGDVGTLFKVDVKNMLNDMIRCTSSEMDDYDISYRPVRFNNDNSLSVTRTFLESLERIEFSDQPSVRFIADMSRRNVLQSLRDELGSGVLYQDGDSCVYAVVGAEACTDFAIPFLDRYRLHRSKQEEFKEWRRKLVDRYIGR